MKHSIESIITEIQNIAINLEQNFLKQRQFQENSTISINTVRYHFGTWNNAVKASGLQIVDTSLITKDAHTLDEYDLLSDLLRIQQKYGKVTLALINAQGKYSERPYKKRWGTLKQAINEALALQRNGQIGFVDRYETENMASLDINQSLSTIISLNRPYVSKKSKKRSVVGEPIDFRGMRFAPVNEQGVVYLFGMVSHELGFFVESVRIQYPDCEGKRCCDQKNNLWEHISIEFEFKSSNFREHGHNIEECDLIVCWLHD